MITLISLSSWFFSPVLLCPSATFRSLTFLACLGVLVVGILVFALAAQITGVHHHSCLYLLLGQLHPLVKHFKELL
uniref:Uncharacterized protein n=1 Tax=Sinocyclocheilus grahami TaxID=75366 RepID=A0A672K2L3_SINGR